MTVFRPLAVVAWGATFLVLGASVLLLLVLVLLLVRCTPGAC